MKLWPSMKFSFWAIRAYLVVWVVAYVAMMRSRGDRPTVRECYDYFVLAWTFEAGELPGFIWLRSLAGFALLAGVWLLVPAKPPTTISPGRPVGSMASISPGAS
jgi:hypothetical protein